MKCKAFLGYVVLPYYLVLRRVTKKRIIKKLAMMKYMALKGKVSLKTFRGALNSYLGILKHCKGYKIYQELIAIAKLKV